MLGWRCVLGFHSPERAECIALSGLIIFFDYASQGSASLHPGLRVHRGSATESSTSPRADCAVPTCPLIFSYLGAGAPGFIGLMGWGMKAEG
jgi:hypothetical protein